MSKMQKMNRTLELFWLFMASIATVFTIIIGFTDDFKGIKVYLLLCGLAWGIYLIRRGVRKRIEKMPPPPKRKK